MTGAIAPHTVIPPAVSRRPPATRPPGKLASWLRYPRLLTQLPAPSCYRRPLYVLHTFF